MAKVNIDGVEYDTDCDVARESSAVGYVGDDRAKDQAASGRGGHDANGKAGVCQCIEGVACDHECADARGVD